MGVREAEVSTLWTGHGQYLKPSISQLSPARVRCSVILGCIRRDEDFSTREYKRPAAFLAVRGSTHCTHQSALAAAFSSSFFSSLSAAAAAASALGSSSFFSADDAGAAASSVLPPSVEGAASDELPVLPFCAASKCDLN